MSNGLRFQSIVYVRQDGSSYPTRVPDIVDAGNGTMLLAWRQDDQTTGFDLGSLFLSTSFQNPDGTTGWGPRHDFVIVGGDGSTSTLERNSDYFYTNITMYQEGGTLYAYVGRALAGATDAQSQQMVGYISTDGGQTWHDDNLSIGYEDNHVICNTKVFKAGPDNYYLGFYRADYTGNPPETFHGVLHSTDLVNWNVDTILTNSNDNPILQEGWLHQTVSGDIAITMRSDTGNAYSSIRDGSTGTWSQVFKEPDLPSNDARQVFIEDSNQQYIYIYNLDPSYNVQVPADYNTSRDLLVYKVKPLGGDWSPAHLIAGTPGDDAGGNAEINTYPSAYEYAPGRFDLTWENGQTIRFGQLDVSGLELYTSWASNEGWTFDASGGTAESSSGDLHLASANDVVSYAGYGRGPAEAYTLTVTAAIDQFPDGTPESGIGLGIKVATADHRLMVAVESTGVWALEDGTGWTNVDPNPNDTEQHTYKVTVGDDATARLYVDSDTTPDASWTIQSGPYDPVFQLWSQGSESTPSDVHVGSASLVSVTTNAPVAGFSLNETFASLDGWVVDAGGGAANTTSGMLFLSSNNDSLADISVARGPAETFNVVLDASVDQFTAGSPDSGVSLGFKAATPDERLILAIQSDGVWAITSTNTWQDVLPGTIDTHQHSYQVTVAGSSASLSVDGGSPGATWAIQGGSFSPVVAIFAQGSAASPGSSHVSSLRLF